MFLFKRNYQLKNFLILWFGQSVSGLGSSMTSFAITIWAYEKTGSALTLSISSLLIMLPKMIGGVLAGPFIDRLNKKVVMLSTDIGAGICTLILFLLLWTGNLEIWHIYTLNLLSSVLGSFQSPANDVAISLIVPKEHYIKTSGLQSFSSGTIQMFSPVLASAMLGVTSMAGVIIFDFITLLFASFTLVLFVKIPFVNARKKIKFNITNYKKELKDGFNVIRQSNLLRVLLNLLAFINLVAGITYYNLLSPMILARTESNAQVLALVNGAIGLGGILGGVLIALRPLIKSKTKMIFLCTGLSFAFGDILLALGNSVPFWVIGGFLSSIFIPLISANQNYFWRTIIPVELQGRAFSFKYALQSGMIPIGLILGGVLADYIFEPFMMDASGVLATLLGNTKGSGMALMFLITGILGTLVSVIGFFSRTVQETALSPHYRSRLLYCFLIKDG